MDTAETIAKGGEPYWEDTFTHPVHGELTFSVAKTLVVADWLRHAVVQEQLGPGLSLAGPANGALASGVAAMKTFMKVPVLSEVRRDDPDVAGRVIVEQTLYDPLEDERVEFVILVWATFFNWRNETLSDATRGQVKNSSGATSGDASVGSSPATSDSPPTS